MLGGLIADYLVLALCLYFLEKKKACILNRSYIIFTFCSALVLVKLTFELTALLLLYKQPI